MAQLLLLLLLMVLLWLLLVLLQQVLVGQHAACYACHPLVCLVSPPLQQVALHQHARLQRPRQTSVHCLWWRLQQGVARLLLWLLLPGYCC
jgi:hypothetical protein